MHAFDQNIHNETVRVEDAESHDEKTVLATDVDEALLFLRQHAESGEVTTIDDKKLMRKVDWLLMPLMFSCYYLQYTDKTLRKQVSTQFSKAIANVLAVGTAAVMGVIEDTHMPSNGFSHLAMAFYVSFLVCEPVQSFLIQKFPTAKYLAVNGMFRAMTGKMIKSRLTGCEVTLWGIIVTMNCVCHSFAPIVALRVLLGVFESSVAPR